MNELKCSERLWTLLCLAGFGLLNTQSAPAAEVEPRLERVVMLMRHGVRPPTDADITPAGMAAQAWPQWSAGYGELTPHGAEGARLMGAYQREYWIGRGLLPADRCPTAADLSVEASSKSRAIETAKNVVATLVPGCTVAVTHPDKDAEDRIFHPLDAHAISFDGKRALAAAQKVAGTGGLGAVQARHRDEFILLQHVLGCSAPECQLAAMKSVLIGKDADQPELDGALGIASTVSQTLLLEYVDGMPMQDVGWGRVSKDEIARLLRFHPTKFSFETRPPYIADRVAAPLVSRILSALSGEYGRLTLLVGHDTNIASVGGMLNLHWQVGEYPKDDPPPGGALGFELLSAKGKQYVRAFYTAQTMDQLRNLSKLDHGQPPVWIYLPISGCTRKASDLCEWTTFQRIVQSKLEHPAS